MRNIDTWRDELFSEIRTLANPFELNRLWSGVDGRNISSFAEEVEHIFSDYDIDGFLFLDQAHTTLTQEQALALRSFRDAFSKYVERLPIPVSSVRSKDVLIDPAWNAVMQAARNFVEQLK